MRSQALLAFAAVSLFVAGCGPRWQVVKQADPNPLTASSKFAVDKVTLDNLRIGSKTEAEWMSGKDADTQQKWEGDKTGMSDAFSTGFDKARDTLARVTDKNGAFVVRARFDSYEPGFYAGVASGNAEIDATVDIVDASGNVVDEFHTKAVAAGMSAGQRARDCAEQIGATTAKYLKKRVGI